MEVPRILLISVVIIFFNFSTAYSQSYDDPSVLSIEQTRGQTIATYSQDKLRQDFPMHAIKTVVPWLKNDGAISFQGALLKDILVKHNFATNAAIEAFAYDDYTAKISLKDIEDYSPILAIDIACTTHDHAAGLCTKSQEFRPLRQEDNGYFRLIWPADKLAKSTSENDPRWIWFIVALRPAE